MANDIKILENTRVGEGFVPSRYLRPGENEYYLRDEQLRSLGKEPLSFRPLSASELEVLVRNNNTCRDWSLFLVRDPFHPELLRNNIFFGLVRISRLEPATLEHHDFSTTTGIYNSLVIACDIGDNCAISDCAYLSHYIIDDHCILINNAELQVSNHAKFGNGIVMESEEESVRITLDVMNENGGRWIYPFNGMLPADAWLWAKFRDRDALMERFAEMTNTKFDRRLGRYGIIGRDSVLKHNRIIKDVCIGESAYIKGSNKLKNLTINSKTEAPTQIGEGVELVNGILGYGCRVFYGCKAVRFVMCDNSALKYGARLIHSVLGENSTVSCCEILNNLIFPAHEQHHNTSFLIASLIKGQSNLAAGATIGSNHNSRAPDGEIEAGRGFWPGLCTSVKHSSRFASFCLLSKSDYKHELDIRFPFCLVDNDETNGRLMLAPAWWWHSNTYALMRNEKKFKERDKRIDKRIQFIYSPFAPDTMTEILASLAILEYATGKAAIEWLANNEDNRRLFGNKILDLVNELGLHISQKIEAENTKKRSNESAQRPYLENLDIHNPNNTGIRKLGALILAGQNDPLPFEVYVKGFENSARQQIVLKPCRARASYREILLWFSVTTLLPTLLTELDKIDDLAEPDEIFESISLCIGLESKELGERKNCQHKAELQEPPEIEWDNMGGFLVQHSKLEDLIERIETGSIQSWDELHCEYQRLSLEYEKDARVFAWAILGYLSLDPEKASAVNVAIARRDASDLEASNLDASDLEERWPKPTLSQLISSLEEAKELSCTIAQRVYATRAKDWTNPFRKTTFRNENEQLAVYGRIEENTAIKAVYHEMEDIRHEIDRLTNRLQASVPKVPHPQD
ncbi:MAG TPA: DUF4954 family protein [Rectinema sp.]|nr:DUF4954 family protein [Rectinema sp.]